MSICPQAPRIASRFDTSTSRFSHVGREEERIAARGADFADKRFARLFIAVEHSDACALPGEVSADRAAQNPGPTRHNDDTAPDVKEIFHVFQMILFL